MRIVTTHAGHCIAANPLTFTKAQFLNFAYAAVAYVCVSINEIRNKIADAIARHVVQYRTATMLNIGVAFQVAINAD
ncbi:MAG: hypothetical protein BGO25_03845 [Acidobacteriales bacterium 59-55]|nr:MAG: hypothetical protein BGO25_03845 [Acidobacteriales bacterium 59-55]